MKYLLILLAVLVAGCSRSADKISAAPVVGTPYAGLECSELAKSRIDLMNKLTEVRIAQNTKAAQDVAGVVLIGFPVTGQPDNEAAIAVMRGQIISIDNQAKTDGCDDPTFGSEEPEITLEKAKPRQE